MSPSLKRLVSTLEWKDVFRLLHPNDLVFSREYDNAVHGAGATRINLLQLRQSYLVKKIQEAGRGARRDRRGPVHRYLTDLRSVQAEIKQFYVDESEKIKIQAKVQEYNENENVRVYHHEMCSY